MSFGDFKRPQLSGGSAPAPSSVWTCCDTLYDREHSSLALNTVSNGFATTVALKCAPIFEDKVGKSDIAFGEKMYDHQGAIFIMLTARDIVVLNEQIRLFEEYGTVVEFVRPNNKGTKTLVISQAAEFYAGNADYADSLAVFMEETTEAGVRTVINVMHPQMVGEKKFYPEMEVLKAFLKSFLSNLARVGVDTNATPRTGSTGTAAQPTLGARRIGSEPPRASPAQASSITPNAQTNPAARTGGIVTGARRGIGALSTSPTSPTSLPDPDQIMESVEGEDVPF